MCKAMNKHEQSTIILITRYPEVGKVKTRLIKSYGAQGACDLHSHMTKFTLNQCQELGINIEAHHFGGSQQEMQTWFGIENDNAGKAAKIQFFPQVEGHLGHKMFAALKNAFHSLYLTSTQSTQNHRKKVLIIGSDCPDNRSDHMRHALSLLQDHDVVLGPSLDGGYYTIGFATDLDNIQECNNYLEQKIQNLFQEIDWGTELVFAQTMAKIKEQNLVYTLLAPKSDVDFDYQVSKKISVIIPTFNEDSNINHLLTNLPRAFNAEILVVDGKSADNTLKIAAQHGAIALSSELGRAKQIMHAASQASGEILLFLHADSTLPAHWDMQIREVLEQQENSLGYFRFGIKENFWTKPIIEWGVNFRCKYFKLPFGDQGLFVRKKDFDLWNLPAVPILEDVFLVKCAQKHGQIIGLPCTLLTSGRRWFKHGVIRTTIMNISVLLCHKLGMDLEKIKQSYLKGKNPLWNYFTK